MKKYTRKQLRQLRKWGYYITKENGVIWRNYVISEEW